MLRSQAASCVSSNFNMLFSQATTPDITGPLHHNITAERTETGGVTSGDQVIQTDFFLFVPLSVEEEKCIL